MNKWEIPLPVLGGSPLIMEGDNLPTEGEIWESIKAVVDPEEMFKAHSKGGEAGKQFARDAYHRGYFEGPGIGEGLSHIWELAKSGVVEGGKTPKKWMQMKSLEEASGYEDPLGTEGSLAKQAFWLPLMPILAPVKDLLRGGYAKEAYEGFKKLQPHRKKSIDKAASWMLGLLETTGWSTDDEEYDLAMSDSLKRSGLPDDEDTKLHVVNRALQFGSAQGKATSYQGVANIMAGYNQLKSFGGALASSAWLEGNEDVDNWIETYAKVHETEKARQRGAAGISLVLGDEDTAHLISRGKVQPQHGLAFLGEIIADPANIASFGVAKGVQLPARAALTGIARKNILGLQTDLAEQAVLKSQNSAFQAAKASANPSVKAQAAKTVTKNEARLAQLSTQIAKRENTLSRVGGKGLVGKVFGSPAAMMAAGEALDLTTDVGKEAAKLLGTFLEPRAPRTLASVLAGKSLSALGTPLEIVG